MQNSNFSLNSASFSFTHFSTERESNKFYIECREKWTKSLDFFNASSLSIKLWKKNIKPRFQEPFSSSSQSLSLSFSFAKKCYPLSVIIIQKLTCSPPWQSYWACPKHILATFWSRNFWSPLSKRLRVNFSAIRTLDLKAMIAALPKRRANLTPNLWQWWRMRIWRWVGRQRMIFW